MVRACRFMAIGLGLAILAWQAGNAMRGAFVHPFLVADLAAAAFLIGSGLIRDDLTAAPRMIAAFSATAGVFLSATTAAILRDGYSHGRLMTGLGLLPCVACVRGLVRYVHHQATKGTKEDTK